MKRIFTLSFAVIVIAVWCWLGWILASRQATASVKPVVPQRIVSLAPNMTELLFALGLGPRIVGVCTFCDYPPEALEKPLIGDYWQPDIEAIIARHPDIIISEKYPQHTEILDRLSRMGYMTASLESGTLPQFFDTISELGRLTGSMPQAAALEKKVRDELAAVTQAVAGRPRPRVLWVVDEQPLRVAGRNTFINDIIETAGGQNAIGPTVNLYPPMGIEHVLAAGVDVIIQPSMNPAASLEIQQKAARENWSRWPAIPAVRNGRIYVIEADAVSRLGPRLGAGAAAIAGILHPECFTDKSAGADR